jgi:hypothetical protein
MLKQILKYMFIYLVFLMAMTALVSLGYMNADRGPAIQIRSTSNEHQFSWPSGNQQPSSPDSPDSIQIVLARAAYKLGISTDEMTQAYEEAKACIIPLPAQPEISQDGQAKAPNAISDDMAGYLETTFKIMAGNLGIPAKDISAAWQVSVEELKLNSHTNSADDNR